MSDKPVCVLGIFVADLTFVAARLPRPGETVIGSDFRMGPGGKGSNQAVAARRAGAEVTLIAKIGTDRFAEIAHELYRAESIAADRLIVTNDRPTGAASITVERASGENAIVVSPGAAGAITVAEVEAAADAIAAAGVFLTQFEVPLAVARAGLGLARAAGATTVLNPAPACAVPAGLWPLVDVVTPNEGEAAALVECTVSGPQDAAAAADVFLDRGVGAAVITLGAQGAFLRTRDLAVHVPALNAGAVVETTGAGDAFSGALAAALAEGADVERAVRFANAAAAISVTRPGTAASMPRRDEIDTVLRHA